MSGKGYPIITAEKEIVVHIKHYFDAEKKSSHKNIYALKSAVTLTALATNLSEISVKRIMADFNKGSVFRPPAPKGSSPSARYGARFIIRLRPDRHLIRNRFARRVSQLKTG